MASGGSSESYQVAVEPETFVVEPVEADEKDHTGDPRAQAEYLRGWYKTLPGLKEKIVKMVKMILEPQIAVPTETDDASMEAQSARQILQAKNTELIQAQAGLVRAYLKWSYVYFMHSHDPTIPIDGFPKNPLRFQVICGVLKIANNPNARPLQEALEAAIQNPFIQALCEDPPFYLTGGCSVGELKAGMARHVTGLCRKILEGVFKLDTFDVKK